MKDTINISTINFTNNNMSIEHSPYKMKWCNFRNNNRREILSESGVPGHVFTTDYVKLTMKYRNPNEQRVS